MGWSSHGRAHGLAAVFAVAVLVGAAIPCGLGAPTALAEQPPAPAPADAAIAIARLRAAVAELSSPQMEGRPAGGPGAERAARWIAARLAEAGVAPGGDPGPARPGEHEPGSPAGTGTDTAAPAGGAPALPLAPGARSYEQRFRFAWGVEVGPGTALAIGQPGGVAALVLGRDFRPLGFSANGEASAEIVFCGYGITAPALGWDDYAGVDAGGKIVLVLEGLPPLPSSGEPEDARRRAEALPRYGQLRYKAMNAREHGAAGMLVIAARPAAEAEGGAGEPELLPLGRTGMQGDAGIVAADLRRSVATGWRTAAGESVAELEQRIATARAPHSAPLQGVTAHLVVELRKEERETANVLGVLRGRDPVLAEQAIVIGAHYDHLGDGSLGGSLAAEPGIHHGADDNASGVAAVLELARVLAAAPPAARPRRTVVFALFGAEELGLLGSAHYVRHPLVPLQRTIAMLNLDMVGRMRKHRLHVGGVGTGEGLRELVERAAAGSGLSLSYDPEGFGPSDHSSFYARQVPVLFLFTGAHEDYHKPSDTADKLDYEGLREVTALALRLVRELDALAEGPAWRRTEGSPHGAAQARRGPSVYLGTIPDYAPAEGVHGVRLAGVRAGSPAERAGLRAGDVIVGLDGTEVRDIHEYTYALFARKPGERVRLVVLRDGERLELEAVLGRRGGEHAPAAPEGRPAGHP
ncbi:MAG: hypothetical protein KatS3mg102_0548 [Planctomycetota bacterium]|nr:MAG: hypothetical protein KatS3mg102_0548 [Planctomycetota bacterium]